MCIKKVVLHVCRRRWLDKSGKSYFHRWDLTAENAHYSKEFAFIKKKHLNTCPIITQFFEESYHIDGVQLERHYNGDF